MEMCGSVEGGREWIGLGEWKEDGDPTGGGGRGDGVIRDATFQKSSKLSVEGPVRHKSGKTEFIWKKKEKKKDSRSLRASQIPSCSAFLNPVTRFVLPHLRKSASFSWAIKDCFRASWFAALGRPLSAPPKGTRCRVRRSGTVGCGYTVGCWFEEEGEEAVGGWVVASATVLDETYISYSKPIGQFLCTYYYVRLQFWDNSYANHFTTPPNSSSNHQDSSLTFAPSLSLKTNSTRYCLSSGMISGR